MSQQRLTINVTDSRPTNIVITGVEFHAGAGMITLKATTGSFDDAFATELKANYSSGFTYLIDGARANEVAITRVISPVLRLVIVVVRKCSKYLIDARK